MNLVDITKSNVIKISCFYELKMFLLLDDETDTNALKIEIVLRKSKCNLIKLCNSSKLIRNIVCLYPQLSHYWKSVWLHTCPNKTQKTSRSLMKQSHLT